MIKPKSQLAYLPDLVVAGATKAEGILGRYSLTSDPDILANRQRFFNQLGLEKEKICPLVPAFNNRLTLVEFYQPVLKKVDAIVTNQPNIFFTLLTADCIPLVLYEPKKKALALVHMGWRNVVGHLTTKVVAAMIKHYDVKPGEIYGYLGPAIEKKCYRQSGGRAWLKAGWFLFSGNQRFVQRVKGSFLFDIKAAALAQLEKAGVPASQIEVSPYCTAGQPDLFPSNFREQNRRVSSILTVVGVR